MKREIYRDEDLTAMSVHERNQLIEDAKEAVRRRLDDIAAAVAAGRPTLTMGNALSLETRYLTWAQEIDSKVVSS